MAVVRRAQAAMATRFEAILLGEDAEHLEAVATLVLEEIDRVERQLSRFDPASEVSRLNHSAAGQPALVSVELAAVIEECRTWFERTGGIFDVTIDTSTGLRGAWRGVQWDAAQRTLVRTDEQVALDFGGYGKGYALDRAAEVARHYGVRDGLLHGGTSSVLALGPGDDGLGWPIAVAGSDSPVRLCGRALSTSATRSEHNEAHDTIDPRAQRVVSGRRSCSVVAGTAALAEILSTVGLVLGPEIRALCESWTRAGVGLVDEVAWFCDQ